METEIVKGPGNSAARIVLQQGESCIAEGGSLIACSGKVNIETSTLQKKGKLRSGIKRMLAGESFFLNRYTSLGLASELYFSTELPGDMIPINVHKVGIVAEGGSFVVRSSEVTVDMEWQGFKSLLSGEGLFWLRIGGEGTVVLSSFGAIYSLDIDGDYIVDTGHIVAFEETLDFSVSKAGSSWISSFLGGEGFVCRFSGKGRLWCQSHHPGSFGSSVGPLLKRR